MRDEDIDRQKVWERAQAAIDGEPLSRRSDLYLAFRAHEVDVRSDPTDRAYSWIFVADAPLCRVHWSEIVKDPEAFRP